MILSPLDQSYRFEEDEVRYKGALQAPIEGSQFNCVPGAGHLARLENPKLVEQRVVALVG